MTPRPYQQTGEAMNQIERLLGLMKRATRLWRVDDAAFLCNVSGQTIRRAVRDNRIEAQNNRIPHSEVVRYCGRKDPFLEFRTSLETLKGKEGLEKTITHLEKQVEQMRVSA